MSSRRRIDVSGGGGAGGGGGPAPTGNFSVGPDYGNPPENVVVVTADLDSVGPSGGTTVTVSGANPAIAISGNASVSAAAAINNILISGGSTAIIAAAITALVIAGGASAAVQSQISALAASYTLSPTISTTAALAQYAINYLSWANANVTTTSITNPANAIDKDTATYAYAQAASTSSPLWLTNNTTNFNLESSFPDFAAPFTTFTIDSVAWEYQFEAIRTTGGVQVTEATVSAPIEYSANDGTSWTTQETVSALGSVTTRSVDLTATLNTWTKISQFRSKISGSVTSGLATAAQSIAQMRWYYSRLRIIAHLDNPP